MLPLWILLTTFVAPSGAATGADTLSAGPGWSSLGLSHPLAGGGAHPGGHTAVPKLQRDLRGDLGHRHRGVGAQ